MEVFSSERTPALTFLPTGMRMLWLELKQPLWTMKACVQKGGSSKRSGITQYLSFSDAYSTERHVLKVHPYCAKYQNYFI